jgi:Amt family ammonium transporter
MVAGFLGGFMTGILATVEGCAAFGLTNLGGAIAGNGRQVWVQIVGALFIIGWNMTVTPLILLFIKYVLRVPLKFDEATLKIGDDAIHGEGAYVFDGIPLLHHGHHHAEQDEPSEEKEGYTPPNVHAAGP